MNFKVPEMSCGHCSAAIEKAVKSADPAASVQCDLTAKMVRIDSTLSADQAEAAIRNAGYEATATAG